MTKVEHGTANQMLSSCIENWLPQWDADVYDESVWICTAVLSTPSNQQHAFQVFHKYLGSLSIYSMFARLFENLFGSDEDRNSSKLKQCCRVRSRQAVLSQTVSACNKSRRMRPITVLVILRLGV